MGGLGTNFCPVARIVFFKHVDAPARRVRYSQVDTSYRFAIAGLRPGSPGGGYAEISPADPGGSLSHGDCNVWVYRPSLSEQTGRYPQHRGLDLGGVGDNATPIYRRCPGNRADELAYHTPGQGLCRCQLSTGVRPLLRPIGCASYSSGNQAGSCALKVLGTCLYHAGLLPLSSEVVAAQLHGLDDVVDTGYYGHDHHSGHHQVAGP